MNLHDLSDDLVRYLNRQMEPIEEKEFLHSHKLGSLKGPDSEGYIGSNERIEIYNRLKDERQRKTSTD